MSTRRLGLLFCLALAAMLALLMPLAAGLRLLDLERLGLRAAGASGSVWSGHLYDARLRGRALGDLDVRLAPLPLLAGTRRLVLANADARLAVQQGRHDGIVDARGRLALADLPSAPGLAATLHSEGATMLFAEGDCAVAEGRLAVTLRRAGDDAELAALAGDLACTAGAAAVALAPQAGAAPPFDALRVELRIEPDGGYRLQSLLPVPTDETTQRLLETAGFQPGPAGWSRIDEGRPD